MTRYFRAILWSSFAGQAWVFLYFAQTIGWGLGILELLLGTALAIAPVGLYTPWFRRIALEAPGQWVRIVSMISLALVALGGVGIYGLMIYIGNFGFWLYLMVPFGQAVMFNLFLAILFQLMLWSATHNQPRQSGTKNTDSANN